MSCVCCMVFLLMFSVWFSWLVSVVSFELLSVGVECVDLVVLCDFVVGVVGYDCVCY